jgi:hypothetical protein
MSDLKIISNYHGTFVGNGNFPIVVETPVFSMLLQNTTGVMCLKLIAIGLIWVYLCYQRYQSVKKFMVPLVAKVNPLQIHIALLNIKRFF